MKRRFFLLASVSSLVLIACKAKEDERCRTCGMKIDRSSSWRAEVVAQDGSVRSFDTPRCALRAWITPAGAAGPPKALRVQEYYDRAFRDATELRFVVGSDVVGPMGPDFVPVDSGHVEKFLRDHAGSRQIRLAEIDANVLRDLK